MIVDSLDQEINLRDIVIIGVDGGRASTSDFLFVSEIREDNTVKVVPFYVQKKYFRRARTTSI